MEAERSCDWSFVHGLANFRGAGLGQPSAATARLGLSGDDGGWEASGRDLKWSIPAFREFEGALCPTVKLAQASQPPQALHLSRVRAHAEPAAPPNNTKYTY